MRWLRVAKGPIQSAKAMTVRFMSGESLGPYDLNPLRRLTNCP